MEMEMEQGAIMWSSLLPNDIIEDIVLRLPVKSLSRFRCVCKSWCNFLNNPNFIKMHIDHGVENDKFRLMIIHNKVEPHKIYSSVGHYDSSSPITCYRQAVEIDYPRPTPIPGLTITFENIPGLSHLAYIHGSCNGLLCVVVTLSHEHEYIWNPSTTEFKQIPDSPYRDEYEYPLLDFNIDDPFFCKRYGFGYDFKTEDYTVVKVSTQGAYVVVDSDDDDDDNKPEHGSVFYYGCKVDVYTLGTNSWKSIPVEYFPYGIFHSGVLVNGNLHWVATPWINGRVSGSKVILSFNFEKERFVDFSPLEHFDDGFINTVGNLRGCLCICGDGIRLAYIEVWMMKDYGVRESWSKMFTIDQLSLGEYSYKYLQPIQFFKNGEVLLSIASRPDTENYMYALVLYNPETDNVRTLEIQGGKWSTAHTYVESLISLKTGTYLPSLSKQ